MLVNFNKKIISLCSLRFFTRKMLLLAELQDLGLSTRPNSRTSISYENALWTNGNGISWISASSTKSLESGERDFELVWLQEEDWTVWSEHKTWTSLLTFYHCAIFEGYRLCFLVDQNSRHVLQCVTAFQLPFTKTFNTDKHIRIFGKLKYFLTNTSGTIFC